MDSPDGKKCAGDGETGTSGPEVAGGLDESGGPQREVSGQVVAVGMATLD